MTIKEVLQELALALDTEVSFPLSTHALQIAQLRERVESCMQQLQSLQSAHIQLSAEVAKLSQVTPQPTPTPTPTPVPPSSLLEPFLNLPKIPGFMLLKELPFVWPHEIWNKDHGASEYEQLTPHGWKVENELYHGWITTPFHEEHRPYPFSALLGIATPVLITCEVFIEEVIWGEDERWLSLVSAFDQGANNWTQTSVTCVPRSNDVIELDMSGGVNHIYRATDLTLPTKQWFEVAFWVDHTLGRFAAYINRQLKIRATEPGLSGRSLKHVHAGLYAGYDTKRASLYNRNLRIYHSPDAATKSKWGF